jgi:threonine dehydrogenase-like Zn-dependent dehydrogenase
VRDQYYLRQFAFKGLIAHQAHPHYSPDVMADYARALAALGRGVFPMDLIVTERYSLEQVGDGFEALISHREGFLKGIVVPQL